MTILPGSNNLSYVGKEPVKRDFIRDRAPLPTDNKPFDIGDSWIDQTGQKVYRKVDIDSSGAVWVATGTVNPAAIETIITDSGTATPNLSNQVNMNGANGIKTSATGNSVVIDYTSGVQPTDSYVTNSGTVQPVSGSINVFGGSGITTSAASGDTIQIDLAGGGTFASLYTCNSGSAAPAAGNINVFGGAGTTTTGSGSTITIGLSGGGAGIDTIIPDAGINVVPDGSGNVSVLGAPGRTFTGTTNVLTLTDLRDLSSFVVNSTVGSEYLTIQSAINAAVADGASTTNPRVVYVTTGLTGQYAENITLADGIHVQATTEFSFTGGIKIVGQAGSAAVTMPLSGAASLKGFIVEAAAGQVALEQTAATTNVIQFEATNCSFDATANVGTYGVNIDNGGSGNAVACFFGNCRFTGSTADFKGGAGLTCSNRNFFMEGAVKGLELTRGANFIGWSFNIGSYVTVDASTFTGIIGGIGDTGVTPPNAQIDLTGASTVILANTRISTLSNPSIRIGENATVQHFVGVVINVGAGTNFVTKGAGAGVATYVKGGVYVAGNVIGIDPTIDVVTTPIQY